MRRTLVLLGVVAAFGWGQSTTMGSRTMAGSWDASNALSTKPMKAGTAVPATCSTGEVFFKTDAADGENLYLCKPDNNWTPVTTGSGGGAPAMKLLTFDGSTALAGETMTGWSCGSTACTTQWTVPERVDWVRVRAWAGGGGGGGSTAGSGSGAGGGGGGYWEANCATTPGSQVTISVGLGGSGGMSMTSASGMGGASSFGGCFTVDGGENGSGGQNGPWGGILNGAHRHLAWYNNAGQPVNGMASNCMWDSSPGPFAARLDAGGCPASRNVEAGGAGQAGGAAINGGGGGGSGSFNNGSSSAGGPSTNGGNGGNGGGWTPEGGLVPCTAGSVPGGGGGAAGATTAGNGNQTGCAGARGEVRLYIVR